MSDDGRKLIFGGIAGGVSKTFIAPLERIRIINQTHRENSIIRTFRTVVQTEGVFGLWRGNLVACARTFPSKAILFSVNDLYKAELSIMLENRTAASFMAGSLAGMTSMILTYPLDLVRTRLSGTIFSQDKAARSNQISKSMFKTFWNLLKNEGPLGLYKGVTPSLLGAIPMEGIRFTSFAFYSQQLKHFLPGEDSFILRKVIGGGLAGLTAGLIMYPNDTLRKNMQINVTSENNKLSEAISRLYKQGGIIRFYQGVLPYAMRVVPSSAIQFGTYEYLKKHFP